MSAAGSTSSPAGASLGWIFGDQNVHVKDKEDWGQVDREFRPASGLFFSVAFGAGWNQRERNSAGVIGKAPGCKDASGKNYALNEDQPRSISSLSSATGAMLLCWCVAWAMDRQRVYARI